MLRIAHVITITQQPNKTFPNRNKILYFDFANSVEVVRSYENFTQTAKIVLPRNVKYNDKNISIYQSEKEEPLIQRGDSVVIEAAYINRNDKGEESLLMNQLFRGWIARINNDVPMELNCEDDMYLLKQLVAPNYSKKNTTLLDLVAEIIEPVAIDIPIKIDTVTGFDIRIQESSIGNVLKVLRDDLGLYSFFVPSTNPQLDDVLRIGRPFYEPQKIKTFLIEKVFIESDLQYLRSEDIKIKVKGTLITSGKVIDQQPPIEVGDPTGDLRSVFQFGGTIAELRRKCEQYIKDYTYTGYTGSFTTFLEPVMQPGDHAIINSYKYPERSGTYLIKSVTQSFGVGGGRQKIELERRIL